MPAVAVIRTEPCYPDVAPYGPSEEYPEYPFGGKASASGRNGAYSGVRSLFIQLGLDRGNCGTPLWNPLGSIIEQGMTVVLKPNFVLSHHKDNKDIFSIITHPSVLRAVMDYCWIALRGEGRIIIADAPQYDCNFEELLEVTHLREVLDFYSSFKGPEVMLRDLRGYWSRGKHFASMMEPLAGDPEGCLDVNIGRKSFLYDKTNSDRLYGACYRRKETSNSHTGERQEYQLSRTIMNADVVISVPKLKVHKKVGVTLNVKGFVGACTNKNLLVHYSLTPPSKGGDQYPDGMFSPMEEALIRMERWMYDVLLSSGKRPLEYLHRSIYALHNMTTKKLGIKVAEHKRLLDAGNWHGNDSAWRMAVDLFTIISFCDRDGRLRDTRQRRLFSVIDGITGGDNNGPLSPDPVSSGVLIGGDNLLAVDIVASRLMGFDSGKIKMYQNLVASKEYDFGIKSLKEIEVLSPERGWTDCLRDQENRFLDFLPHPGWLGHIEIGI